MSFVWPLSALIKYKCHSVYILNNQVISFVSFSYEIYLRLGKKKYICNLQAVSIMDLNTVIGFSNFTAGFTTQEECSALKYSVSNCNHPAILFVGWTSDIICKIRLF